MRIAKREFVRPVEYPLGHTSIEWHHDHVCVGCGKLWYGYADNCPGWVQQEQGINPEMECFECRVGRLDQC